MSAEQTSAAGRINAYVDANRERMLSELQACLRQPSFAATGEGIAEGVQMVREILERRGMHVQVIEAGGHPVVLGAAEGTTPRSLLLYQHYDVLPPGDLSRWDSPPFAAETRDGHIYARGVADHKGSFMARVHAVDALLAQGPLPMTVKFLVEGEEEIGSTHLPDLIDKHRDLLVADAALYSGWWRDEEGRPRINCGMSGSVKVRITSRTAKHGLHGRHAPVVPNAAWLLTWALASIKGQDERVLVEGFYDDVEPLSEADQEALARIPFNREVLAKQLGLDSFLGNGSDADIVRRQVFEPTVSVNDIKVGDGSVANIPCIAHADLNFRLVPRQDPAKILAAVERHLAGLGWGNFEVELRGRMSEPARVALTHPIVQVVQQASAAVYGVEPVNVPISAGTGPRHLFVNQLGVPMIADPGVGHDDQRDHGFNENIRIEDYFDGVKVMANIIERFAAT